METYKAFAMGMANAGKTMRVFDWDKAAKLIKERKPHYAAAGLGDNWEWTGGDIYRDGKIVTDDYTYLSSTWAIPELYLDGEIVPCWIWETETDWNSDTKWPESAKNILFNN